MIVKSVELTISGQECGATLDPVARCVYVHRVDTDECADPESVRAATEDALGVWLSPLPDGDEWQVVASGPLGVARRVTVALLDDQPTHRLDYRAGLSPSDDAPVTSSWLVLLHDEGGAYTRDEWERAASASWSCDDESGWLCEGQVTPGGANGTVTVTRLRG